MGHVTVHRGRAFTFKSLQPVPGTKERKLFFLGHPEPSWPIAGWSVAKNCFSIKKKYSSQKRLFICTSLAGNQLNILFAKDLQLQPKMIIEFPGTLWSIVHSPTNHKYVTIVHYSDVGTCRWTTKCRYLKFSEELNVKILMEAVALQKSKNPSSSLAVTVF